MKLKQFALALYSCLSPLDSKDDVTFCFVSHVTSNSIWLKKKVALPCWRHGASREGGQLLLPLAPRRQGKEKLASLLAGAEALAGVSPIERTQKSEK